MKPLEFYGGEGKLREMQKKKRFDLEKGELLPFLLLLPTLLVVLIVMIIPLGYGAVISLFNYKVGATLSSDIFVGLSNYTKMLQDPVFWKSLLNTVLFSIMAIAGDFLIGTFIAVLLLQLKDRTGRWLRAIFTMPLLISPIIVGLIWKYVYDPASGILYWFLGLFGLGVDNFPGITSPVTALFSVAVAHWWQTTPFVLIIVTAGLVSIDSSLYEAAEIDGANAIRKFFSISLPLLKKIYMVIMIISGVDTFKVFDIVFALTQGGPANSTLPISVFAYNNAFESYQMGYAMAISITALIVSFIIFGVPFIRFQKNSREE
jgi:ABC-type sugar transport systems, permease components